MYRKLLWFASLTLSAGSALAQSPFEFQQFSTTMVMQQGQHPQMSMKMYRSGNLMRTDMPGGSYAITHTDTRTTYMVMGGHCMQMQAPPRNDPFATASEDAKVERSAAGSGTVDGHSCKIENVTVIPKNGKPTTMKVWEAQDLKGFPVKIEMQTEQGPATMLYRDVSFDKPAASVFEHPSNCMQMPYAAITRPQARRGERGRKKTQARSSARLSKFLRVSGPRWWICARALAATDTDFSRLGKKFRSAQRFLD